MRMRIPRLLAVVSAAGLALAAAVPNLAQAAPSSSGDYSVRPIMIKSTITAKKPSAFPTPAQCLAEFGMACNTPQTIRAAYDIPATIDGQPAGTGETIAIIDAYGSPTAQADLDTFSATMGIPSTKLNIFHPTGAANYKDTDLINDWATETSLDVQWAHAIAPGATIDLVVASTASGDVINKAIKYATDTLHADAVSMSFGSPEGYLRGKDGNDLHYKQAEDIFAEGTAKGTTYFASSGDGDSDNGLGFANYLYPASDSNVTSVGGTNLFSNVDPSLPAETVWNDFDGCPFGCTAGQFGGTGGAPSFITDKGGSDVAYDASVYTGVMVQISFNPDPDQQGLFFAGGTSAGSPQWAAIAADLDQSVGHDLGNLRPSLPDWAAAGALRDVTVGDNKSATFSGGFSAGTGWDVPTGWGTPDVGRLLNQVK